MSKPIIEVKGLSKRYKLGVFNAKTLREEAEAFLSRFSRKNAKLAGGSRELAGPSTLDPSLSTPSAQDEFWALRDVSFDVQPGEVIGVIGRNGAGKSTLLKILSRITEPTSGEARIRGRVASLLEVGTGFHPELSGRENIFLNGAILGMTKQEIRNKFDEIVAFAEIEKFIDTPVKRYSSGMYVRLAFAVAAHLEPEILIVDEVLAVGDAEFQRKCLGKMKEVSGRDGRTVIFVSHALGSVQDLCDRTILIQSGEKVFDGETRAAINRYLDHSKNRPLQKAAKFFHRRNHSDVLHVFFGEELAVEFDAELPGGIPAGINISFHDSDGRLTSLYSTDPHDGVSLPRGSKKTITFSLLPCLLAPGRYTVDLALTEPGVRTLEEAPAAFILEVAEKALGGRWPYRKEFGASYLPHAWRVE